MKIYVVETLGEDTCQLGFSTSKKSPKNKQNNMKKI